MNISAAILAVSLAAPVSARTIRTGKGGDYETLQAALAQAKAGDVVEMTERGSIEALLGGALWIYSKAPLSAGIGRSVAAANAELDAAVQRAGLRYGDRIERVDGVAVSSMKEDEFRNRMGSIGPPGSKLRLSVRHPGASQPVELALERLPVRHEIGGKIWGPAGSKSEAAIEEGQPDLALQVLTEAAGAGDVEAKRDLGSLKVGIGNWLKVPRDDAGGLKMIRELAEQGDVPSQMNLGHLYHEGRVVAKDDSQYFFWNNKAAQAGNSLAARNLGWIYALGLGVAADHAAAQRWFETAIAGGNFTARGEFEGLQKRWAGGSASPAAASTTAPAVASPPDVDNPSYSRSQKPHNLAVVIGIDNYQTLPEAIYAERDARAVHAHLVALGYPERNIFMLTGAQATKSAFIKELEARLKRLVKPDSEVFVYYSGHGAPDPKTGAAYLVPYDGDPEFLDETAYPVKRLYTKLGALGARRVVVALDSCFSGAGGRSVLAKGARPLVSKVDVPAPTGQVAAMTAASNGEIAGTFEEQRHGIFTYYLLDGLNQGKTSLGDLAGYLTPKVQDEARRHNRDQTPQLIGAGAVGTYLDK